MLIANIAEISLKNDPQILAKVHERLDPLRKFFPENKDSILESSVVPDLITSEFN